MKYQIFAFLLLFFFFNQTKASSSDDTIAIASNITHLPAMRPNNPVSAHLHKIPFSISLFPENRFEMSYTAGNTWKPTIYFIDQRFGSQAGIVIEIMNTMGPELGKYLCETCPEYQVPEIPAFNYAKIYRADGVLRQYNATFVKKTGKQSEITFNTSVFKLVGGDSPLDFFVSDAFIEGFHKVLTPSIPDPFQRQKREYDQAGIRFITPNKKIVYKKGDTFWRTFDIGFRQFYTISQKKKWLIRGNSGINLGIPLNKFNNFVSTSFYTSANAVKHLSRQRYLFIGGGAGLVFHRWLQGLDSMIFFDNNIQYTYSFTMAMIWHRSKGSWTAGIEFLGESRYMNRDDYVVFYETLGEGQSWKSLGGKNTWLFTMDNQYLGFVFSHTLPNKKFTKGIKIIEDGNFRRNPLFVIEGAVAQDIGIELFCTFSF